MNQQLSNDSSSVRSGRSQESATSKEAVPLTVSTLDTSGSAGLFLERYQESKPLPLSTQRYYSLNWKFWRRTTSCSTYEDPGAVVRKRGDTVAVLDGGVEIQTADLYQDSFASVKDF